jgi:tetratricopeptide (TPR) repeat protein
MSNPRLFVSYSTRDGSEFADFVYENYSDYGYEVFMSSKNISGGEHYEEKIMNYIAICDIFILIVTNSVVYTPPWVKRQDWIEKEFSQAERSGKRIIPCIHKNIKTADLKQWKLWEKIGPMLHIEKFDNSSSLITRLDQIILKELPVLPSEKTTQIHKLFSSLSDGSSQNYPRKQETGLLRGLLASSKDEHSPSPRDFIDKIVDPLIDKEVHALFNKAYDLAKIGRYKESIDSHNEALRVKSSYADVLAAIGDTIYDNDKYQEAIAFYDSALRLNPNHARAWYSKGRALNNLGRNEDADVCLKKARDLGYKD